MPVSQPKNVAIVVVTGDRGLCGGYNAQMIKKAEARIVELKDQVPTHAYLGWHAAGRCLQCGLQVAQRGGAERERMYGLPDGQWNPLRKQIPILGRRAVLASSVAEAWHPCMLHTY